MNEVLEKALSGIVPLGDTMRTAWTQAQWNEWLRLPSGPDKIAQGWIMFGVAVEEGQRKGEEKMERKRVEIAAKRKAERQRRLGSKPQSTGFDLP